MQPTTIQLNADKIDLTISGIDYSIDRALFEQWLTDDNGCLDVGIDSGGEHYPNVITMEQYWLETAEINDTMAKLHIGQYCEQPHIKLDIERNVTESKLRNMFDYLDPATRAEAYSLLLHYGMLNTEYGERRAADRFKRILNQ